MIYGMPVFGEGLLQIGMGLGNRLFPWARCRVFCASNRLPMISPVWFRPAVGQLFRGGVHLKSYARQLLLMGILKPKPGDVNPMLGKLLYLKLKRVPEHDWGRIDAGDHRIVVFRGINDGFCSLNGNESSLLRELELITCERWRKVSERFSGAPIVLNVRCGNDFLPPREGEQVMGHQRTSLEWFVRTLRVVRSVAGENTETLVISDGHPDQLFPLLELKNVSLLQPRSAISDLLVMAHAQVLLASGASSFSAWGCFLGKMPAASRPGQDMAAFWGIRRAGREFIGEIDPEQPEEAFLAAVARRLGG